MNRRISPDTPPARSVARLPWHRPRLALARLIWIALVGLTLGVVAGSVAATVAEQGRQPGVIGADYSWNATDELVIWPWPDFPAAGAGIDGGEVVIAIDGTPVLAGLPMAAARTRLDGPIGTPVVLTIRDGDGTTRQYALTRAEERMYRAAARLGLPSGVLSVYFPMLEIALMLPFLVTGLVLALRRFDDWFLLFASLGLVLQAPHFTYATSLLWQAHPEWGWAIDLLATLAMACALPFFYLFPDGRFVPRWTAPLTVGWVAWVLVQEFFPGTPVSPNSWPAWLQELVSLGWYSTGVAAQVYRYRRVSGPIERQQTKWVVLGLAVAVLGSYGWAFALIGIPAVDGTGIPRLLFWLLGRPLYALALLCVPLAIAAAVLRYRLWDIDVIINRALVYGALTVTIAVAYSGGVAVLQALCRAVIGQRSNLAIVAATLAISTLAQPLRRRIQDLVDHRFYRRKYDAARTLAAFGATLRAETNLEQLHADLVAVVEETMQPTHVSLWLRPPDAGATKSRAISEVLL